MAGLSGQSCWLAKAGNSSFYAGMQSMGPAVQYLAGELVVEQGMVLPLLASHNTVRMRFDIEEAEYMHLAKPDAAFPALHFSMLADRMRNQVDSPHSPYTATVLTVLPQLLSVL